MRVAFGDHELDLDARALWRRGGERVPLHSRPFALLAHLVRHRGRVVSREELIAELWPGTVGDAALDQAVRRLRTALGDERRRVIRTHRGQGYAFEAACRVIEAAPEPAREAFVGRQALLAELEDELRLAFAGSQRVLLLSGEAGIGKSRTAEELASRAAALGGVAWTGRAVELGAAPPYWMWSQVLRRAFSGHRTSPVRKEADVLRHAMPEIGVGEETGPTPRGRDATQALFRLAGALARALRAWSQQAPLLLVLDDLHRADPSSLRLLDIVAAETGDAPIAFLGTHRDAELRAREDASHIVASIRRGCRARSFALEALTAEEVAGLARQRSGCEVSPKLACALHGRTGGNPFFLVQLLALHRSHRSLESLASTPLERLPGAARDPIRAQVGALPGSAVQLLELGAGLGREIDPELLAAAAGEAWQDVADALDVACESGLLRRFGRLFRFVHALVPETLLADLDPVTRRAHHRRLAHALEARDDADARRAAIAEHHLKAAMSGDAAPAIEACRRADEDARQLHALDESARWSRRALALADGELADPPRRLALLLELGESSCLSGELETGRARLREAFALARRLSRFLDAARAALLHAGYEEAPPLDDARVRLLERALEELPAGDSPLRARLLARLSMALLHGEDDVRRRRLAADARAMAVRIGDDETTGHVDLCVRAGTWSPDDLEERLALDRELHAAARRLDDPLLLHDALANLVNDQLEAGDLDAVDAALSSHRRLARQARQPFIDGYAAHFRVMRALLSGDHATAESALPQAFALSRRSDPAIAAQWYGVQLYGLRRAQGRLHELRPALRNAACYAASAVWRSALAFADLTAGDEAAARDSLARLMGRDGPALSRDYSFLSGASLLAELCAGLGARDEAAVVHAALEPFGGRHVVAGVGMLHLGPVERFLGQTATVLGRWDEAQALLDRALAEDRRLGARSSELRTRRARLALLEARGAGRADVSAERRHARAFARRSHLEGELRSA